MGSSVPPRLKYEVVKGYFLQDEPETEAKEFDYVTLLHAITEDSDED